MHRPHWWSLPSLWVLTVLALWGTARAQTGGHDAAQKSVTVSRVDEAALKARLATLKGKVIVMNLWATWCVPCVEEFPHLVTLSTRYRDRGLDVIAVSIDEIDSLQTAVVPFLTSQRATFTALIKETTDDERFMNAIDPAWPGVVPATFIYDRSGVLRTTLLGKQKLEAFEAAVKPLLDEPRRP